jgi:hypothetical protein
MTFSDDLKVSEIIPSSHFSEKCLFLIFMDLFRLLIIIKSYQYFESEFHFLYLMIYFLIISNIHF